jgi:hypothetical protein
MKVLLCESRDAVARSVRMNLVADLGITPQEAYSAGTMRNKLVAWTYDVILCSLDGPFVKELDDRNRTRVILYSTELGHTDGEVIAARLGHDADYVFGATAVREPLVVFRPIAGTKSSGYHVEPCLSRVRLYADTLKTLDRIELTRTDGRSLTEAEERVVKIYAARQSRDHRGRVAVEVSPLAGGRSRATTLRLIARAGDGTLTASVVLKVLPIADIRDERERYETFVAARLPAAVYAPLAGTVEADAGSTGGICYGFANQFTRTLRDVLHRDPDLAAAVVGRLREATGNWHDHRFLYLCDVDDVRGEQLSDAALGRLDGAVAGMSWREAERRPVLTALTTIHNDLHGDNVLVDEQGRPILLDYGRVTRASAAADPVALELSAYLHGDQDDDGWPTVEQAERWYDLDHYVEGCGFESYLRACRDWSTAVATGKDDLAANVLAAGLRRLRYAATMRQRELAAAVVRGAVSRLLATKADAERMRDELMALAGEHPDETRARGRTDGE